MKAFINHALGTLVTEGDTIEGHSPNSIIVRRNTKTLHRLCLSGQMGPSMAIFNTSLSKNNQLK